MQLIFLNRYFYPDHSATSQLLSDLAFSAAEKGWSVVVLTSRQCYQDSNSSLPENETLKNVQIERVWTSRYGRAYLGGRFLDYLTFYVSVASALLRRAKKGDIIIAKTDPPMLSILVSPIALWCRARQINWLQDLFPEVAEAYGMGQKSDLAKVMFRLLHSMRNWSLRRATCNVPIGHRMAQRLEKEKIPKQKIRVIENWADGENLHPIPHANNPLRQAWRFGEEFVVAHSGNLGRAHDFETCLSAIETLHTLKERPKQNSTNQQIYVPSFRPKISWLFIGGGAHYDILKKEVTERGLSSVRFLPYQEQNMLAESLSAADAHLITLKKPFEGLIVPSKFYGIAAVGRPIIFIGDLEGEIQDLIRKSMCGFVVQEGDQNGLVDMIQTLAENKTLSEEMGRRARDLFDKNFSRPLALLKWQKLFEEITSPKSTPRSPQSRKA